MIDDGHNADKDGDWQEARWGGKGLWLDGQDLSRAGRPN